MRAQICRTTLSCGAFSVPFFFFLCCVIVSVTMTPSTWRKATASLSKLAEGDVYVIKIRHLQDLISCHMVIVLSEKRPTF